MENNLKTRDQLESKFKWRIQDLFSSDDEWDKQFASLKEEIKEMASFEGALTADNLFSCLEKKDRLSEKADKLYVYANLRLNEDQANTFYQGMADKAEGFVVSFQSAVSYIEPEILSLNHDMLKNKAKGSVYEHFIDDLLRLEKHVLSAPEENILARVYELSVVPENIFSMINNADMSFPPVTGSDGAKLPLSHGKYISFLEDTDRSLRKDTFNKYYDTFYKQKNTIAATYSSSVKKDIFISSVRKHSSALEASLAENNIPVAVYKNLISTIGDYLPLMHRYISLRKKSLGLDALHMYDLYVPIVKNADIKINYEDAKKTVSEALKPLGNEYSVILEEGLTNGWIDVYENKGKRSGAYAWGAYGHHPYVSMNYNDTVNSMFTLAHEMGHAIHSYYSWGNQPYVYGGYTIFVAEVASTVNEVLLMNHLLDVTTDKTQKRYLLNYFLEQFRGTVFRQTMFAEFELIAHETAEAGIPLTFDSLCEIYNELNLKYYGRDIVIDREINWEWMRIPHFYNAFYVYQYATGYTAAVALTEKILREDGRGGYINFLKSGSSDYSINLLKKAGVDMTTPEPVKNAMIVFENILKQMEDDSDA